MKRIKYVAVVSIKCLKYEDIREILKVEKYNKKISEPKLYTWLEIVPSRFMWLDQQLQ